MSNVVDLTQQFQLDNRAKGFLNALRALAAVSQPLGDVLCAMQRDEQRVCCQIIAERLEGAIGMRLRPRLVEEPLLIGMSLDTLQEIVEAMFNADVFQKIVVAEDRKGDVTAMMATWPALERLLLQGEQIAKGPQLTTPSGAPLRP